MKVAKSSSNRRRRGGAAVVEAAIVLPLLICFTFAAVKYGWLFYRMQQITNIARQAARLAIRPSATDAGVQTSIDLYMAAAGMALADVSYTRTVSCQVDAPNQVTVFISVPTSSPKIDVLKLNAAIFNLPGPDTLHTAVTMSKEGEIP